MKKDNFDLRAYLIENKMTENSRGDVRHHLGEAKLDTRLFNTGLLVEMKMPAEGDAFTGDEDFEDDPYGIKREAYGDHHDPDYTDVPPEGPYDSQRDVDFDAATDNMEECGPELGNFDLEEAGYTDDDDDWQSDDLDLDDRGGASLLDLVGGRDKNAARARKAAAKDTAEDPAMDDDPAATDAPAVPDADDPDAENAAGESDPNAEVQHGLASQIKYNPNTVELEMDQAELDQYLSGFRRPQVAVNVLNRAIRTAQSEVNDSIGLNHLYLILQNGFYETSRTEKGRVIAKISADMAWRKKNFPED